MQARQDGVGPGGEPYLHRASTTTRISVPFLLGLTRRGKSYPEPPMKMRGIGCNDCLCFAFYDFGSMLFCLRGLGKKKNAVSSSLLKRSREITVLVLIMKRRWRCCN